jgi:hypothetical protein
MDKRDFTFQLDPGQKRRYIAGVYNPKEMTPRYEITINAPHHVKPQILCEQILLGNPENCKWACDFENKSTWPVFVIVKKDAEMLE